MEIIKKIIKKQNAPELSKVPTIAFLGDSITQGFFEFYLKDETMIGNVYEEENAYPTLTRKALSVFFPDVPVNIIHAGIGGDNAVKGLERLERDVLSYSPDLVVVCFGLNDSSFGLDALNQYKDSLKKIFEKIQATKSEIIFMTPNMMNTYTSPRIEPPTIKDIAESTCKVQNGGIYDIYLETAKTLCNELGIPVCDCYKKWKILHNNGVDVTKLLANKINHPIREMHWLFAGMLLETMLEN